MPAEKLPRLNLLFDLSDFRKPPKKETVIFSPVGDLTQLKGFCRHVRKLGIDQSADFVFIYRPGLQPQKTGLSEVRAREKSPLGTSGCFFAGQALSYLLGYKTIVVADLDAFLDSKRTFDTMLSAARKKRCAVVSLSKNPADKSLQGSYCVVNQWGVFPRQLFESEGFAVPYTVRGAEDYELLTRLSSAGKLEICRTGFVLHPRAGYTIYHKMAEPRKFYPYVAGLLKAHLISLSYSKAGYLRYAAWYLFYSFFADALSDSNLSAFVSRAHTLCNPAYNEQSGRPNFAVRQFKQSGIYPNSAFYRLFFIPYSLVSLLISKKVLFATDELSMNISRLRLFYGIIHATMLAPFRLLEAAASIFMWKSRFSKEVVFPIMPKDISAAVECYARFISS
jgi:hypothetical protein